MLESAFDVGKREGACARGTYGERLSSQEAPLLRGQVWGLSRVLRVRQPGRPRVEPRNPADGPQWDGGGGNPGAASEEEGGQGEALFS